MPVKIFQIILRADLYLCYRGYSPFYLFTENGPSILGQRIEVPIFSGSTTVSSGDITITINLWEDDHQDPVLTTITDPALLNDQDGQWDEFDYTGRPYPTILAGHNEWENNGLQPMHFFADGIPNGSYEVWANLYTGRHTRHYYGFTETEALTETRWVDNVAGAGGSVTAILRNFVGFTGIPGNSASVQANGRFCRTAVNERQQGRAAGRKDCGLNRGRVPTAPSRRRLRLHRAREAW